MIFTQRRAKVIYSKSIIQTLILGIILAITSACGSQLKRVGEQIVSGGIDSIVTESDGQAVLKPEYQAIIDAELSRLSDDLRAEAEIALEENLDDLVDFLRAREPFNSVMDLVEALQLFLEVADHIPDALRHMLNEILDDLRSRFSSPIATMVTLIHLIPYFISSPH